MFADCVRYMPEEPDEMRYCIPDPREDHDPEPVYLWAPDTALLFFRFASAYYSEESRLHTAFHGKKLREHIDWLERLEGRRR